MCICVCVHAFSISVKEIIKKGKRGQWWVWGRTRNTHEKESQAPTFWYSVFTRATYCALSTPKVLQELVRPQCVTEGRECGCSAVLCCVVCCGVEGDTFIAPAQMYRKLFEICRSSDQPANAGSALLRLGPAVGVRDNVWNLSDGWINVCIAMDKQIHSSAPKKQMVGGF